MLIYVYEHLTIQGIGQEEGTPEHSLYREGRAMWSALREDLQRVGGVEVTDDAAAAEAVVVIAPECGGLLADLSAQWDQKGVWRIGPTLEAIRLTSDKWTLAQHWQSHGVPTPQVIRCGRPLPADDYPLVWKPRDGCGSQATFLLEHAEQLPHPLSAIDDQEMLVQRYVPGLAASVAFLCGPSGQTPLVPAQQCLSADGRFRYQGGTLPLPEPLARRALRLAQRAVACVPGLRGYVGVDLVLGPAPDGSQDYAIEINPRLTTSYIGLRALCYDNLAESLLTIASGGQIRPLRWRPEMIHFQPDGTWQCLPLD
ncbi:MAG: ATP-grasp domain-containing protein [Gemmataceae bacterium]|nr:ATP-grasp domain-containing protein [Gemmataceae bacterium]MDW8242999.1 ATP-grasp domain-containing protein [Thermogemmata sp.]